MKILVFGKNGQVGRELQRTLHPLGDVSALDREEANLEHKDDLFHVIEKIDPKIIVNAAAYTAVDLAEKEKDKAHRINATAVWEMAQYCKKRGSLLVHYSTDYVFDGKKKEAYLENDKPAPINFYGKSKLEGERSIIQSRCAYLIFRTSWVYSYFGKNFIKTMWRLAQEREKLEVVYDQVGAPTSAYFIAEMTAKAIEAFLKDQLKTGIYHLTPSGTVSWHQLATYVIRKANNKGVKTKVTPENISAIKTESYPTPAKRPKNSVLDHQLLENALGIPFPRWQDGVDALIDRLVREGLSSI